MNYIFKTVKYSVVIALMIAIIAFGSIKIISITKDVTVDTEKNGKVILIDPGHGGNDPGAVSSNGTRESELNLCVALYLKEYLVQSGYEVIMTRGDKTDPGLDVGITNDERKKFISNAECDIVVSIHMNKFSDSRVHGAETYYYSSSEESKNLAEFIQTSLKNELDSTNTRTTKAVDNLFVLKINKAPSVLVECGYISNRTEENKLLSPQYQRRIAFSIFCGISAYYQK